MITFERLIELRSDNDLLPHLLIVAQSAIQLVGGPTQREVFKSCRGGDFTEAILAGEISALAVYEAGRLAGLIEEKGKK